MAMKTGAISKVPTLTLCHLVHTKILTRYWTRYLTRYCTRYLTRYWTLVYSFAHHLTTTIHPAYLHTSSTSIAIHMHPSEPYHSVSHSYSFIRIHPYLAPRNVETNAWSDIYIYT